MNRARSLITVVVSSLVFSFLGGVAGFALGTFAPGYYRGVFASGSDPTFKPVEVGLGLGISQGLMGGALIGVLLVFAHEQSCRQSAGEFLKSTRNQLQLSLSPYSLFQFILVGALAL